ncbi:MAG: hypothetical protein ACRDHO_01385 [Actinomycetota bacterium]
MDDQAGTLIRFAGVLREDHRFVHVPAWETAWVFERPEAGDGSYVVDLLDTESKVVSRASPQIEFRPPEDAGGGGLWLADVLVYVPMHPDARVLLFRRMVPDELEIHRAELAARPPLVTKLVVEGEPPGELQLTWTGEHDRPVTFSVFFWPDTRSPLLLASGIAENAFRVAGSRLPGPAGSFAVAASDGYRSGVAVGRPMTGFSVAVRMRITTPLKGSVLPPDQSVDLVARAEDVSGTTTDVDEVTWSIDGEKVAQGPVAAVPAPQPGEHEIQATGVRGTMAVQPDAVTVTVVNRSEAQEELAKHLADLPPLEERRRQTGV